MVKIAAIGDNVVDCYLSRNQMYPGGNCLNVSVLMRRFGAETAYIGAVGRDRAGNLIETALVAEGVDISHFRRLDGSTAYCVIGHKNSDRFFVTFDLGVSIISPTPQDTAFTGSFDAVHVGQSSGLDGYLADIASGTRLSYDFSVRRDSKHRRKVAPLAYLASMSGGDLENPEIDSIARELLEYGAKNVLITRGREGASLFTTDTRYDVEASSANVVDTLGAGDTFIARTLYGLVTNEEPVVFMKAAADASAVSCSYFGAIGYGAPIEINADLEELSRLNSA